MEVAVESLPKVGSYIDGRSRIVNSKYLPPALEYFGNGQAIQTSSDQHARTSFGQQQSSSKSSQLSQAYRIEIDSKELSCSKCSQLYTECKCVEPHPVGPAYFPNHDEHDVPRYWKSREKVVEKVPEMKEVEETRSKQKVSWETRLVPRTKTVIVYNEVEHIEIVPVVKYITKTKPEIYYHVVEEEIEVPVMEQVLLYEEISVTRQEPRFVTEDIEEIVRVPVVKHVPVTKVVRELTGNYQDSLVNEFVSHGKFNLTPLDSSDQHNPGPRTNTTSLIGRRDNSYNSS